MVSNALLAFVGTLLCSGVASWVFSQAPRSFVHWTCASGMMVLALREAFVGLGAQALLPVEVVRWQRLSWAATALLPGCWLLFSLSFARSNYRELVAQWKWFALGAFALPLALVIFFRDALLAVPAGAETSFTALVPLGWAGHVFFLFFIVMSVVILMNLEETLKASTGSKRWQIKFMILGLGSVLAVQIYTMSQTLLFSSVNRALESVNSAAVIVADVLIILSLVRHRLLEMDIYPSQALVYKSVTALVAGIYLLAVGVLAMTSKYFDGNRILPLGMFCVFLALLGLTIILLSDQLQQEIKRFISRHFYRALYDYRNEWRAFTRRTTSVVDIKELCAAVSRMASETFGVPVVTIWLLREESQDVVVLGGSTALSNTQGCPPACAGNGAAALIHYLRDQQTPVDFDTPPDARAKQLKQAHPDYFRDAQIRYAVPLVVGQQVLGLMTLHDRLTQEPFSTEDYDLLKTIADQAAASLLNLTLSQRLLRAKQMEALQTLSAFFVHDLKNLASRLSLTMQNLPAHYDNPAFRDDMLRVISGSVDEMHTMCSRLSLLTKKLELHRTEADLNELVQATLADLNGSLQVPLRQHLYPVPRCVMDPEQLRKVLVNLLLNANEALDNHGEIRVTTERMDGWAVFSVSDTGCGMSKEFMERSLFQPFQTTKRQGLGIGLFQSKMIVEAHQGRIEVQSEEGKGSTFRVLLPLSPV